MGRPTGSGSGLLTKPSNSFINAMVAELTSGPTQARASMGEAKVAGSSAMPIARMILAYMLIGTVGNSLNLENLLNLKLIAKGMYLVISFRMSMPVLLY